jgi:hypothetical protein
MFVVIGILDLLAAVAQVPEYAHAVLDDLVADIGLLDRGAHDVEQSVDETLALAQLLPRVFPGARDVPQDTRGVPKYGRPAGLAARGARVPATVRYDDVDHHHRHAVVDDGLFQILDGHASKGWRGLIVIRG